MPIQILPPEVADKIAAGEVIERPASVVKELVENAIDADADDIRVEITKGGRQLIQVSDNGRGIPAAEVELAFARHATSKLRSAEDLYRVRTLGFRGEALASIAAVSQITLSTRAVDEEIGTLVRLQGGTMVDRQARGRPPGTTIMVENLFYNTPARLKFLRADATEAGHVARLVTSYALAYPEQRISLQNNQRQVLRTAGTGQLADVLIALYGLDVVEQMLPIERADAPSGGIQVWGYVSMPDLHRATRQDITFLVNHRWIQDNSLAFAVSEAYRSLLPSGRQPVVVLNIELPPEEVDVNIHPTKREVRFRHQHEVFAVVQRAVRRTLMAQHPVPLVSPWERGEDSERVLPFPASRYRGAVQSDPEVAPGLAPSSEGPLLDIAGQPAGRLPMLRVLGQVAQTYIIAEGPGGIYLIDQHAAHERIRYEELRSQQASGSIASQQLLNPLTIEPSPQRAALLEGHLELLSAYGFEIIPFGGTTFLVKRVPAQLMGQDVQAVIAEIVDAAADGGDIFSWAEQTLVTLSCHTAIRAGQTLSMEEMRDLVRQLEQTALPHTCPHGRRTMIHVSQEQLEKEFGRA